MKKRFPASGSKIGVVELDGVIFSPKQIVPQLKKFADDDSVKAIIIHVNSPGGGVAASEEIYREVKRIRDEKKKRIVASIETVGASGAYYVASATNKIYADKGSVVGSIGVIAEWVNYGELLRWAKLNADHHEGGGIQGHGQPDARNDARGTRVHAGLDRQHAYAVHPGGGRREACEGSRHPRHRERKSLDRRAGGFAETGGSDRGFRRAR